MIQPGFWGERYGLATRQSLCAGLARSIVSWQRLGGFEKSLSALALARLTSHERVRAVADWAKSARALNAIMCRCAWPNSRTRCWLGWPWRRSKHCFNCASGSNLSTPCWSDPRPWAMGKTLTRLGLTRKKDSLCQRAGAKRRRPSACRLARRAAAARERARATDFS